MRPNVRWGAPRGIGFFSPLAPVWARCARALRRAGAMLYEKRSISLGFFQLAFEAPEMLVTGYQLAAARALIGLKRATLARRANVSADDVAGMEAAKAGPIGGAVENVQAVQAALEASGVEFLNHGQPGVRLRNGVDSSASIAVEDLNSENDE